MFRELFSLPGRLLRPTTKATAEVIDAVDPLETGIVGDAEEIVSPITDTVGDVVGEVGDIVGGVADDILDCFGF